ncbi:MAG TPA: hypothetical protein VHE55_18700 [Fimbriimonadaceae bacterium]|nr:hypothetical protein [Fimbriimonadaceae bacterium]
MAYALGRRSEQVGNFVDRQRGSLIREAIDNRANLIRREPAFRLLI